MASPPSALPSPPVAPEAVPASARNAVLPLLVVLEVFPCPSEGGEDEVRSAVQSLPPREQTMPLEVHDRDPATFEDFRNESTGPISGISPPTAVAPAASSHVAEGVSESIVSATKVWSPEEVLLTSAVAARIPYVVSALSAEWQQQIPPNTTSNSEVSARVRVFMPSGCPSIVLRALVARLAIDSEVTELQGLEAHWQATDLVRPLQLVQVASMLQIDDLMPELMGLVRESVTTEADFAALEATCHRLELPTAVREAAAEARRGTLEPACLPDASQVRGMIASALLTADGKVWRVVQKVIDSREAWPRLAKENAAVLLAFVTGTHGSIRATPHTGFFWGSRDLLFLVCRYIRNKPQHFDAMVSAMFDSVYSMDPELPAEISDAVFKELLVHEGLSFAQCEHVIAKLLQREDQLEYLFHEWSGVFPTLPGNTRRALAKGLLPTIGRCPHAALDFVLKELDSVPTPAASRRAAGLGIALRRWFPFLPGHMEEPRRKKIVGTWGHIFVALLAMLLIAVGVTQRLDLLYPSTGQGLLVGMLYLALLVLVQK